MDYQEIVDNLSDERVIELMTSLGTDRYIDREGYICFPTICHNTDVEGASNKLYFYKDTKLFVCYTCCGSMSIFKLLKTYYETRQISYDWETDIYNVVTGYSSFNEDSFTIDKYESISNRYKNHQLMDLPSYSTKVLDCFSKIYPVDWLNDRISKEAMDRFNIRFSISQNKIVIPHYSADGRLVGLRGRALDEWEIENIGKYTPIKIENVWYKHPLSLNLYGLNVTKENIRKTGVCFIFEAEKSVLQMESYKRLNCAVAVCGSNLNKFQLKILLRECSPREIILCFDKEELVGSDSYFFKLWNMCKKYERYCNFSFIYDRENLLDLKDSPTDKGEEVFSKLLEKRVVVR